MRFYLGQAGIADYAGKNETAEKTFAVKQDAIFPNLCLFGRKISGLSVSKTRSAPKLKDTRRQNRTCLLIGEHGILKQIHTFYTTSHGDN